MNNRFLREAGKLKSQLVYLSGRVEEQLTWATEAVVERDAERGRRVVTGDKAIDALEVERLKILAFHQPVASDLRLVAVPHKKQANPHF